MARTRMRMKMSDGFKARLFAVGGCRSITLEQGDEGVN